MILTHVKGKHSYYTFVGKDGSPFMTTIQTIAIREIMQTYGPDTAVTVVVDDRRTSNKMLPVTVGDLRR